MKRTYSKLLMRLLVPTWAETFTPTDYTWEDLRKDIQRANKAKDYNLLRSSKEGD